MLILNLSCHYRYVGDEYGTISVLKFHVENRELLQLPYQIIWSSLSGAYCIILVKIFYLIP